MNERIKELILQTDAWCEQNLPANWTDDVDQYLPLWNAKFAELIVQDICDWIDKSDSLPSKSIITTNIKSRYISKHFGVEE